MLKIETERLCLRQWREDDLQPFSAMNADPEVMRFFPNVLSASESRATFERAHNEIDNNGYGFWAVERNDTLEFIGFIGIQNAPEELPFSPCVEIGWRLAKSHWGKGLATEGALAALDCGFNEIKLDEIVSFTTVSNLPSQRVMQKIGMTNANENFLHPALAQGHSLAEHVLYRLRKNDWLAQQND